MTSRHPLPIDDAVCAALGTRARVVLAVSGGLDSMVLLEVAARVLKTRPVVATFDHGTGPSARKAADLVRRESARLGLECVSSAASTPLAGEAALRTARWRFLREVAAGAGAVVATAHTEDDQIETVLMRIMRESGARGLAGLYARADVVRPLVEVRRRALQAYATERGIAWVDDPSNATRRYARNRIRHDILPALRRVSPTIDADLLRIARDAARWRDDVESYVERELGLKRFPPRNGLDVSAAALGFQSEPDLATLWPAVAARAGVTLDRRGIARLSRFTASARVGARVQVAGDWEVVRSREAFQLRAARGADLHACRIRASGARWGRWTFRPSPQSPKERAGAGASDAWCAWLPFGASVTVRAWRPGDALTLGNERRSVKGLLAGAGITGYERSRWPVVLVKDRVVWIPGVRRSDAAAVRSDQAGLAFVCECNAE